MIRDMERIERIQQGLREDSLDAVACALSKNVLLLSGYWPVVGWSIAIATSGGRVAVVVPEDEKKLAEHGWADEVRPFAAASLEELRSPAECVLEPLTKAAGGLQLGPGSIVGYENAETSVPAPYAAMGLHGAAISGLLQGAIPGAKLQAGSGLLERLRSALVPREIDRVRAACRIGGEAFREGAGAIRAGMTEAEAANAFHAPLSALGKGLENVERADGSVWCMSGPNSAEAHGAYARTRSRVIRRGDFVLVHCNAYADGYWTDITRTFCIGEPDQRKRSMYDAVFSARRAAFQAIRPGANAADVDRAAREVLQARGFGKEFKHPTGHGVGFDAISPNARPRIHPVSPDVLETGMVFNVEPAIYFEGYGGLRHCDMVLVTNTGAEVLTPWLIGMEELVRGA